MTLGLSNAQYDQLMRQYSRQQSLNHRALTERRKEAYAAVPALSALEEETASFAVRSAKAALAGDTKTAASLRQRMREVSSRRAALLAEHGFSPDYLEMQYLCPDCQDTGYIGTRRCHCFQKAAVELFYTQSGLRAILEEENFTRFSLDWYSDTQINPVTKLTPRENMRRIHQICLDYVRTFDTAPGSLLFTGGTGLGKTFLSHCIARELIETSHAVIYYSAFALFESMARETFGQRDKEQTDPPAEYLQDCDLLIIDDLGTEMTNSFVVSSLFQLLNERIMKRRGTIISTNLSLSAFADTYTERIFSRITSAYTILGLYGEDIRLKKKLDAGSG